MFDLVLNCPATLNWGMFFLLTGGMGVATSERTVLKETTTPRRAQKTKRKPWVSNLSTPMSSTGDCDSRFPLRLKANYKMDNVRTAAASRPTQAARDTLMAEYGLKDTVNA